MAALIANLFRRNREEWKVVSGRPEGEQTLKRPTVNTFGEKVGEHTMTQYKNDVRNPEARGIFNDTKAPFTEIIMRERNTGLLQQRQRITDEILDDCQGRTLYEKAAPKGVLDLDSTDGVNFTGNCDAGNGRVHSGEYNEFDACGTKKVFNMYGMEVGTVTNDAADCKVAPDQGAHFRTIVGKQRDDEGNTHLVIENRLTSQTLVDTREGAAFGDTMTQFHYLEGLRDERQCARYGTMCGY